MKRPMEEGSPEASSSSMVKLDIEYKWVVEMERKLSYIDPLPDRLATQCIFRVPKWIKNMTNSNAYRPWLVSLGPYHHGDPNLQPMEEHKRRAVLAVVRRMNSRGLGIHDLFSAVNSKMPGLMEDYDDLDEQWRGQNGYRFMEMMIMDGCFLLEIMRVYSLLTKNNKCESYRSDDPVFSRRGFLSLYLALRSDVIVMENQLPLRLLKALQLIINLVNERNEVMDVGEMVLNFLGRDEYIGNMSRIARTPLDIFHLSFCGAQVDIKEWGAWDGTMSSVEELAQAGIHFKKCNTGSIHVIDFQNGVLTMPEMEVNDRTEKEFLNLMAFERLYGSAGNDATAFMIFMDHLIDSEKDVALLRSKGVIKNMLSNDKEAAKLFNTLSKGALLSPSSHLHDVRRKVNEHCKKPWNVWRANFRQNYMNNPWVFSAFVGSVLLVIATILQTIYTVMPYYTKS